MANKKITSEFIDEKTENETMLSVKLTFENECFEMAKDGKVLFRGDYSNLETWFLKIIAQKHK